MEDEHILGRKILDTLKCPICWEQFECNSKILQCIHGHNVCTSCKQKVSHCPMCRADFKGTRNFALEEIIKNLHRNDLPVPIVIGPRNLKHNLFCGPKQKSGKFPCIYNSCKERLPICRLLNHIRSFHMNILFVAEKNESKLCFNHIFCESFGSYGTDKLPRLRVFHLPYWGIFYLHIFRKPLSNGKFEICAWINMLGSKTIKKKITYRLEVNANQLEYVYTNKPHSIQNTDDSIMAKKECLNFRTTLNKFGMSIEICMKMNNSAENLGALTHETERIY